MLPGTVSSRLRPRRRADRRRAGDHGRGPPARRRRAGAARRAAPPRGRLLARRRRRGPGHRRPRPARVPAAVPRQARRPAGSWPRRRRRSTSSAPTSSASSSPARCVVLDVAGAAPRSLRPWAEDAIDPHLCVFEFFYFARPDSRLYGRSVHAARVRMGELLAEQAPAEADMVMGVPESGIAAAEGFAKASGIPYGQGLVKNRYIGRTFIAPTPELRDERRAAEAQPAAGEHRRQAHRRRRRLDRPGHHPAPAHADAPGGRRRRDPPAHHQPAGALAVLLRHRHRRPVRAARRPARDRRGDPQATSASTASPTSASTG